MSTLRRQVVATRVGITLRAGLELNVVAHPHTKPLLKGVALINSPIGHRFPNWDFHLVLNGFTDPPFEPIAKAPLKELSLKTLFLVAITLARRILEIGALSVNLKLCNFHEDRVVLRPDLAFIPKNQYTFSPRTGDHSPLLLSRKMAT